MRLRTPLAAASAASAGEFPETPLDTGDRLLKEMDNLSYRCLGAGFALLTAGLISGAVWANEAWGSYWSWDPKETWALITWFTYATYLHSRLVAGKSKKEVASIGALGFIVGGCAVGVNPWGVGLHPTAGSPTSDRRRAIVIVTWMFFFFFFYAPFRRRFAVSPSSTYAFVYACSTRTSTRFRPNRSASFLESK